MKGGPEGLLLLFLQRSVYELLQASWTLVYQIGEKYDSNLAIFIETSKFLSSNFCDSTSVLLFEASFANS